MDIRAVVTSMILAVAAEQSKVLRPLTDDLPLLESGLDSLSLAVIVARLEDELGTDPFNNLDAGVFPNTIGSFIRLYEHALL